MGILTADLTLLSPDIISGMAVSRHQLPSYCFPIDSGQVALALHSSHSNVLFSRSRNMNALFSLSDDRYTMPSGYVIHFATEIFLSWTER
jgi:hypothetical protein